MKQTAIILSSLFFATVSFAQNKGIVNNTDSPNVKLKSINIGDCHWTKGFWADKFKICEEKMLPYMGEVLCGDVGHGLNNFKYAAGLEKGKHKGFAWHDGDFYKWMEASAYVYAQNKDPKILKQLDDIIAIIAKAQLPNGYLQTTIQLSGNKIDPFENRKYHEMYNSGHLYTSACIHYRVTGKKNFLDIAVKHADNLYSVFFQDTKHYARFGFNQTQIMGLVELYRTTKDKKYLALAEKFINRRGHNGIEENSTTKGYPVGDMVQEFTPLRESSEAVGHAVLALYYYAGAADVAAETGEKALMDALDRLWDNVTNRKMYVTGAVGQTHYGASTNRQMIEEGFIDEYMMPNMTAYNETCANICNSMFSYRMMGLNGKAKYADVIENVLFNSALSGINLEGDKYYYSNPLRKIHGSRDYSKMNTEYPVRQSYLECFCCPPNLVRTVAQVSGWAYSLSENGVSVNLFGGNKLDTKLLDGSKLKLEQVSNYPWDGNVKVTVNECKKGAFEMLFRIPNWAKGSKLMVNGVDAGVAVVPGEFAVINRSWKKGDVVTLDMPMEVTLVEGHGRIEEVRNQVAVKRGPVVYCAESTDLPKGTSILDVYLSGDTKFDVKYRPDLLGGITSISTDMMIRKDAKSNDMYRPVSKPVLESTKVSLVPYYAWSNRGDSEMTVFLPIIWK
ncbi:glycoside hydrolase family 127 protein [Flavobacterium sp. NG2]|uniref:glycoside hydrolase family 127 protein n=1 Tax=Flavobacterium sp. NG2 TaxID=3097547 RepID=UPI002A7F06E3|nr:beta-L-arabinofuranosidase domain-containing protein [Flavobacterium sp. NG2]WPR71355.1 glycoside hydrolase family 127 protein [Flavobacterium sp. NG2]